jgi:hypothetical protein
MVERGPAVALEIIVGNLTLFSILLKNSRSPFDRAQGERGGD